MYENIKDWEKLLNIPETMFNFVVTQEKKGFKDDDNKDVACYDNLKDRKGIAWYLDKKSNVWSLNGKDGIKDMKIFSVKPTEDKIAVTKKERRLLWNRTALDRLFKIMDPKEAKDKNRGLLPDGEASRVNCIDFTIGDPKIEWTASDGKIKHKWEDVWRFVGSKNFVASLPKDGETIRVYEEYLGTDNKAYLSKNSKDFKYIGKQNGKQVVEITFASSEDAFSTTTETEDEDDEKGKRRIKRLRRDYIEEDQEEDDDVMERY